MLLVSRKRENNEERADIVLLQRCTHRWYSLVYPVLDKLHSVDQVCHPGRERLQGWVSLQWRDVDTDDNSKHNLCIRMYSVNIYQMHSHVPAKGNGSKSFAKTILIFKTVHSI